MRKRELESYVKHYYEKGTKNYNGYAMKIATKDGSVLTYERITFRDAILMENRVKPIPNEKEAKKWKDVDYFRLSVDQKVQDVMGFVYISLSKLYKHIENKKSIMLYHEYGIVSTDSIKDVFFIVDELEYTWDIHNPLQLSDASIQYENDK
jgi:hypothetical protein